MEALLKARIEISSITAEIELLAAVTRDIPPAADKVYKFREQLLVYSESKKE